MKVITARNVNDAYCMGWQFLEQKGRKEQTRNGEALVAIEPVTTVYEKPNERCLFDRRRKANPYFHMFESMWMLAGRNDAAFLDKFVHTFGERYAQPDGTIWGAYGHRWINQFGFDQLECIIANFKRDQYTRQCVLTMWDPNADLEPKEAVIKDRPCNTHIYFRNLDGALDMTVCCRSNDMIWGAYGANAVHMSILHEYLASRMDMAIGFYYQISNNFHAYTTPMLEIQRPVPFNPYTSLLVEPYEMFETSEEAERFIETIGTWISDPERHTEVRFIDQVLYPMWQSHVHLKNKEMGAAINALDGCKASDWKLACLHYIEHRMDAMARKQFA